MTCLSDLLNPTFLIYLGILILIVGLLIVFFESKMREQNHKISSMLSLVSTLAEDVNNLKMGLNHLAMPRFGESIISSLDNINNPFLSNNDMNNNLIEVSDNEEEEENEQDDEDDEDDDDEDDDDEDDEDDENLNHEDIKVLKLNISEDFLNKDSEIEEIENVDEVEDLDKIIENNQENLDDVNFKTININLEETIDYKKLSLNKLKSIASEKGITQDTSKLKKNDLLKLLGIE